MNVRNVVLSAGLAIAGLLHAGTANAQVGYTPKASGFDLNFSGTGGQAGTADVALCDAQGNASSTTGEDVDGNGVNDRQVYVDLTAGSDSAQCGLPGAPCRTLGHAMGGTNTSVAGGPIGAPAAAQIQAICFKGTGREMVVPTQSGANGTFVLPRTGHQTRAFNLPRYPFILSGWDADNDDRYPPQDADDVAVLDGTLGGTSLAHAIENTNHVSNLELAHFTAKNYGRQLTDSIGFMKMAAGGGTATQIYVHDLELTDIMKAMSNANTSGHIVFDFFTSGTVLTHVAIVNVNATNAGGGYFIRGGGTNNVDILGPYRFQNISLTAFAATDDSWNGIKLWSTINGIEVLDNNFDLNPRAWSPHAVGGAGGFAVGVSYCSSDWTIRGNVFLDFKNFVIVSPYYGGPGYCELRLTDNIVIDRNYMRNTYEPWAFGDDGIQIQEGKDHIGTVGSVTITNNFLSSSAGWQDCIWSNAGNPTGPQTGTITIAGNTCYGAINRFSALVLGNVVGATPAFPQQTYVIRNNLVAGTSGGGNVLTKYGVGALASNGNVFDPQSGFSWVSGSQTLSTWKSQSGGDQTSKQCVPTLVNAPTGNLRLTDQDTCAKAAGISMSSITQVDIEGSARSSSTPSIGAHEQGAAPTPPPATPAAPRNLRILP